MRVAKKKLVNSLSYSFATYQQPKLMLNQNSY